MCLKTWCGAVFIPKDLSWVQKAQKDYILENQRYEKLEDELWISRKTIQKYITHTSLVTWELPVFLAEAQFNIVLDLREPSSTQEDEWLAGAFRMQTSISRGDALYEEFHTDVYEAVLDAMRWYGIDDEYVEFARESFSYVDYQSTYTEENPELWMEPGNMWDVTTYTDNILKIPLRISMRHVQDMMGWEMGIAISDGILSVGEAIQIKYLTVLLHEALHVASAKIHNLLWGSSLTRSGLEVFTSGGDALWDMRYPNEVITETIASHIFLSDAFRERIPVAKKWTYNLAYQKHFRPVYASIESFVQNTEYNYADTMTLIYKWYFWGLSDAQFARVHIFWQESILI